MTLKLTSILMGITEPLEFTFLYVAPLLYVIHAVLEGLSYMLMHMLNVAVGVTFSRGIVDFTIFGVSRGCRKLPTTGFLSLVPYTPLSITLCLVL